MKNRTAVYSLYVLCDDRTWDQPSFVLVGKGVKNLTSREIQMRAETYFGGRISFELAEDNDCDPEHVVEINIDDVRDPAI